MMGQPPIKSIPQCLLIKNKYNTLLQNPAQSKASSVENGMANAAAYLYRARISLCAKAWNLKAACCPYSLMSWGIALRFMKFSVLLFSQRNLPLKRGVLFVPPGGVNSNVKLAPPRAVRTPPVKILSAPPDLFQQSHPRRCRDNIYVTIYTAGRCE